MQVREKLNETRKPREEEKSNSFVPSITLISCNPCYPVSQEPATAKHTHNDTMSQSKCEIGRETKIEVLMVPEGNATRKTSRCG